jgi:hypothetical protein
VVVERPVAYLLWLKSFHKVGDFVALVFEALCMKSSTGLIIKHFVNFNMIRAKAGRDLNC